MITVYAKQDCGCCTEELEFRDVESAARAFAKVGYGNGMEVEDDAGKKHTGLDTFYGFSTEEDEQSEKSLGYLADKVLNG